VKVCTACHIIVFDNTEVCPVCSGDDLEKLLGAPYDGLEPYLGDKDGE